MCTAYGIPFVLQMAVNAKNQHQIEALGLLAANLKASRVSFSMLQATGTFHDRELFISIGDETLTGRVSRLTRAV